MAAPIGFVLLTHSEAEQILRLVQRLNQLFASPPIACHHDFSKCPLAADSFPANVAFVRPHVETQWAGYSLVEGTLRALRLLYGQQEGPDWFVLLSGADYPIKTSGRIIQDLNAGAWDAHIHHEYIDPKNLQRKWHVECDLRYFREPVRLPRRLRRLFGWEPKKLPRWLINLNVPFSSRYRCYAGSQWFSGSRKAAQYIIQNSGDTPLVRYCRRVPRITDELYFQTLLGNSGLRLCNDNHRYIDWMDGQPHPKTLTRGDIPKLMASPCHFARKVAARDFDLMDAIDQAVDQSAQA